MDEIEYKALFDQLFLNTKAECWNAFQVIEANWEENALKRGVKYIFLAEYPLSVEKYIYNENKYADTIQLMQEHRIVVVDLLPFVLKYTVWNELYARLIDECESYYAEKFKRLECARGVMYFCPFISQYAALQHCQVETIRTIYPRCKIWKDFLPEYNPRQDSLPTRVKKFVSDVIPSVETG